MFGRGKEEEQKAPKVGVPKLLSYIMHPSGRLAIKNIKSHRAFQYKWGLYEVNNIYALPNQDRMMLHSVGKSASWSGDNNTDEDVQIADRTFMGMMLETLNFIKGYMKRPFNMPNWMIMLAMFGFILAIVFVTKKP